MRGHRGHDRMIVGFTNTCAISAFHHLRCELETRSWRDVIDTTLCDKVCQWLATGQWFSLITPVTSTNKTEILLKVVLNIMNQKQMCTMLTCSLDDWNGSLFCPHQITTVLQVYTKHCRNTVNDVTIWLRSMLYNKPY